ncbi:MAG: glycosyl hydrolase [Gemmatimonadaceae bacterium]|nr:glycosyl hydrolase [Gemmatimonadaceae bacterium]
MPTSFSIRSATVLALSLTPVALLAQGRATVPRGDATRTVVTQAAYDSTLLGEFAWRPIGPAITSGRIVDFAIPEGPVDRISRPGQIIYAASASGGVWRTVNGGTTWEPIFDKYGSSSIGDIAVAPSNPDLLWVGTGESNNQRSSSWGDGVYKSENSGKTWTHMGLRTSQHIGRIVIHPTKPDIVFVASAGPLWASGGERGLYKTTDGGKSWKAVIKINEHTGVTDVIMEPGNPDVMYAAAFQRQRKAYSFVGGGPESAIYKSTDGGETWTKLTEGLPKVDVGRIGLDVSRSRPGTVYATIENKGAEIYRSDDYGASWRKMGNGNSFPWYMGQIRVDPKNPERIYHMGVPLQVSEDGGRTFRSIGTGAHVDHHALWIDPTDSDHFVNGNDGGVYVSRDRGVTMDWSPNLPVSQYYAIATDMREPYYFVYGGLQDNGSWAGPSRTRNRQGITNNDWYKTTGGDGFQAAIDPTDHNVVYGEWQEGSILRYDVRTGEQKTIRPEPAFGEKPFRWNWNAPILVSPHDHKTIYFGANFLFKSTSRGDAWERLGGDLTRQLNRDTLPLMGKKDWKKTAVARHAGVAEFGNISTIDESPLRRGVLFVGTDDGLVQISRDDGKTWDKVSSFPGVPSLTYVSRVVASKHEEGTVYVTLDNHRSNDFKPYIVKSTDYGKTWTSISSNLPANGSVQVIREHHRTPKLLFAGTEFGAFYSSNGGTTWAKLPNNLPTVAVHDIVIHPRENDLVIGTHGRGIYILDDITPLEKMAEASASAGAYLFPAKPVTLYNENSSFPGGRGAAAEGERTFAAPNPAFGSSLTYFIRDSIARGQEVTLGIFDSTGKKVRDLTTSSKQGMHRVTWDLRLAPAYIAPRGTAANRQPRGAFVLPGRYTAKLSIGRGASATVRETVVEVRADPLVQLTAPEYRDLHAMRIRAGQAQASVQAAVRSAEQIKTQVGEARTALRSSTGSEALNAEGTAIEKEVDDILTKLRGRDDSTPADDVDDRSRSEPSIQSRVDDVAGNIGGVTSPATQIQRETLDRAIADLQRESAKLNALITTRIPPFYQQLDTAGVPWSLGRPVQIIK